ncbi:MAG: hypothetical protein ACYTHN_24010, partial [Planctomycetota bacterium]
GVQLSTCIGSAPLRETATPFGITEGNYTYFTNDIDAFVSYKTEYGDPRLGLGISIYEGWAYQEQVGAVNPVEYQFHFREDEWKWLKIFAGYRVKFKKGHYLALDIGAVAVWSISLEAGFTFM